MALSARILSQGGSTEPQRNNELDSQPVPAPFTPKIGVYLKNYAGRVESVIGESSESSGDPLIVTLPVLKVEDHIWEGKSLTLECWGNKPSIWEYRGHGVSIFYEEKVKRKSRESQVKVNCVPGPVSSSHN